MPTGTVKWFNRLKRFGFITPDEGGNDVFVHMTAVNAAGLETLEPEQKVTYELQADGSGRNAAVNLSVAE